MAFEKFTKVSSRGFRPIASIRMRGKIGLNQGSIRRYGLDRYEFAVLYYDKDTGEIGIAFTNDQNEEGAANLKFNKTKSDASISARAFFDFYDIDYSQTRRYDVVEVPSFQGIVLQTREHNGGGESMDEQQD